MNQETPTAPTSVVAAPGRRNLPAWLTPTTFIVVGAVIIGVAALLSPNFGVAAIVGGLASIIVALLAIVFLFVDQQREERLQLGVTAAVLVVLGAVALLGNSAAYQFTIAHDEATGNYGGAVTALRSIGKKPPYATDLADAYLNWATTEVTAHAFDDATAHLNYVVTNFPTLPEAAKAQMQLPGVYLQWGQFAISRNDAVAAGSAYQTLLTKYGSSAEAGQAASAAPAAFLAWGDAEMAAQHTEEAATAYQLVIKYYPKSAQAAQAHTKAATALSDWAKALSDAHRYSDAYDQYLLLAKSYADTPEGVAAKKLLAQGVQLIGRLMKKDGQTPVIGFTTVRLSSHWTVVPANASTGQSLSYVASGQQYFADTDANGYFVFPSVPSGTYLLEWRNTTGIFLTNFNGNTPLDLVTLRPLENQTLPTIVTDQG